jgi:hypothetical protein
VGCRDLCPSVRSSHEGLKARHYEVKEDPNPPRHALPAEIQGVDILDIAVGMVGQHLDQPACRDIGIDMKMAQLRRRHDPAPRHADLTDDHVGIRQRPDPENHIRPVEIKIDVNAIGEALDLGQAQSWPAEAAVAKWGQELAVFALGSNSRVGKARRELGWTPTRTSVIDWVKNRMAAA